MTSIEACLAPTVNKDDLIRLHDAISTATAIVVGGGAGLSTSAGLDYAGPRFEKNFADFKEKYGLRDMYSAGFYPFATLEERWAYWSRHIYHNRYAPFEDTVYAALHRVLEGKKYFVITTNADGLFMRTGFAKENLFYVQGDYALWQCCVPCHEKTYANEEPVRQMIAKQENMRIPTELIPYCPQCGRPMTMNLRIDGSFVEGQGWQRAEERYKTFLHAYGQEKVLFLELGVGENTPSIIKYPFWGMTEKNPQAVYVTINKGQAFCHPKIQKQSLCIDGDIGAVLQMLTAK